MSFTTLEEANDRARTEAITFADWLWLNVDEEQMSKHTWSDLYEEFKKDLKFRPSEHAGL